MQELSTKWTKPETVLRRFEMPMILAIGGLQFGFALSFLDAAVWRMATAIPFTGAAIALLAGLYVAVHCVDEWR